MPFTFAHPAIVLPFGRMIKNKLSLVGLVIGSLVPDFEYFLRLKVKSIYSHTVTGLFWFDLPLGLTIVLLYQYTIKNELIAHFHKTLKTRFIPFAGQHNNYTLKYIVILCISVFIGAATHLLWDNFTHPTGYFVSRLPILSHSVDIIGYKFYNYNIVQHCSTIIGLVIILIIIIKLPKVSLVNTTPIISYWLNIILIAFIILIIRYFSGLSLNAYGDWIVSGISGFLSGLIIVSIFSSKHSPSQSVHQA
ncbi:DUF4184 family protein [Mucilaginibacter boryungensis]|uniref:DUF4184 family protein n=1 Tax=Mucilaginibacter boryungensis TaxID=768480 RepID=A0ABR9XIY0_9SPHI|nr:DUF4184 family protein [Mucilaginibacter boryungensis]MBE9667231.1 DUF4184 family protein [Mucilaginibacter boryungensis]